MTVDLGKIGKNEEEKDSSGLFSVFMQLTLGKWGTPYLLWGGILLLLTIFTVLSSAHLSEPEPLDKSRKGNCHCHLQNGICDI